MYEMKMSGEFLVEFLVAFLYFVVATIPIICVIFLILLGEICRQFVRLCLCVKYKQNIAVLDGKAGIFMLSAEKNEVLNAYCYVFQGQLNLEAVRRELRATWTDARHDGHFLHPIMSSRIARACGYFYWIPEDKFSIDEHVQLLECKPPENDSDCDEIFNRVWNQPIPDHMSPWKVFLFPLAPNHARFGDQPHYAMLLRIHHGLADGFSTFRMVARALFDEKSVAYLPSSQTSATSFGSEALLFFISLFYTPLYVARQVLWGDANSLHGPKQSGKRALRFSKPLELSRVKRVGKVVGATVNDVLASCVTAACKEYFAYHGDKGDKGGVGIRVHAQVPISMHADTDKVEFKNNTPAMFVALPVARNVNTLDRLKLVHKELVWQKTSYFHHCCYLIIKHVINRLPQLMTRVSAGMSGSTLVITNVSSYRSLCVTKFGDIVKDCLMAPTHNFDIAVGISVTTYNGKIQLGMSADQVVVGNVKTLERFLETCIQEFHILEEYVTIKQN